jgi:dienelactone hydrolase
MSLPVTTSNERPVFFPVGDDMLFGILTEPMSDPKGVGVIILSGGVALSTGVNALSVRFCRRIASLGFHAFRFDYHGVGESSGGEDRFHIAAPFVSDLQGAIGHLQAHGLERFLLVGSCFGARTVLTAAPAIKGLLAAVLVSPPVRDFAMGEREVTRLAAELSVVDLARRAVSAKGLSGLLKADRRRTYARLAREKLRAGRGPATRQYGARRARYTISPRFVEPLLALAEQETPVLLIYGDADDFSVEFQRAAASPPLGEALNGAGAVVAKTLSGTVHGFTDSKVAGEVFDTVIDWIAELPTANSEKLVGHGQLDRMP